MSEPVIDILLVEDNPGDARLTMQAFESAVCRCRFQVASDGLEALTFLRQQGRHAQTPLPRLILLDLNLPEKDGREVLEEIKSDENLRGIPVVVLSASAAEKDIQSAYELNANCYVNKPADPETFQQVLHGIAEFWLTTVSLPVG